MSRLLAVGCACCLVLLTVVGCGGGYNVGLVTGQVTLDGEALPNALVTFTPVEGGRAATGKTDASGNYELFYVDDKGAPIGKHKVSVTTLSEAVATDAEAAASSDSEAYEKQAMGDTSAYDEATVTEKIPARYNTETTLEREVTSGDNVINLELTTDGGGSEGEAAE
jgi:hypothetical protein